MSPDRSSKREKQRPSDSPPPGSPTDAAASVENRTAAAGPRPGLSREFVHRANSDVAAFLVALDAAYTKIDAHTIEELRDAADRLLHACARTRLELERLTASPADIQPWATRTNSSHT